MFVRNVERIEDYNKDPSDMAEFGLNRIGGSSISDKTPNIIY